ncbi:hypothetical protein PAPH110629_20880 [Paenibacillus phoenicis]
MSDLQDNSYKKVSLEAKSDIDPAAFKKLDGVSNLELRGSSASFMFKGSLNAFAATNRYR